MFWGIQEKRVFQTGEYGEQCQLLLSSIRSQVLLGFRARSLLMTLVNELMEVVKVEAEG